MTTGSSTAALTAGPSVFNYVSFIWQLNMMGIPLEVPLVSTGNGNDSERRMVYWREDPAVNFYHLFWHRSHPYTNAYKDKNNRRGELFYYLHQQIIARYNVERLCNGLNLVRPLQNWDEPIEEDYFPVLNSYVASRSYPTRWSKMKMRDVDRKDLGMKIPIDELKLYERRVLEVIYKKKAITANGTEISIDNDQGIDILGDMIESSDLSPDQLYYGSLHNLGHIVLSVIHDPINKYNLSTGVLFTPNTAMRDPLFYRWHSYLNSLFEIHKASLKAYNNTDLSFSGIQVTNVELISNQNETFENKKNSLYTYMMKNDVNMTQGLDFLSERAALVRLTYQNHDEFNYIIEYISNFQENVLGTVRIFLLPVVGFGNFSMKLSEQRALAIEMDKFVHPLKPGKNKIFRKSTRSSVTIPFEQGFRDLNKEPTDDKERKQYIFCGCGWPHHLLVPRGTAEGYPMLLFAMITDATIDRVDPIRDINPEPHVCKPNESVCGLVDRKYPDKRPVGFPFDRPMGNNTDTIDAFLTPNMAIKPITIFHLDEVRPGKYMTNTEPIILKRVN